MPPDATPPPQPARAGAGAEVPQRLTFPRSRRVRDRRDFQRIQGKGQRLGGRQLLLLACRQARPGPARLGITASRKTGDSVRRNRIRRLVREAFRLNPDLFPPGLDFVVIAREGAHTMTLSMVISELTDALRRLGQGGPRPGPPQGQRRPRPPRSQP